jgi:predicted NodU family carbamoyl transferase
MTNFKITPFEEAAALTMDGVGEQCTASLWPGPS